MRLWASIAIAGVLTLVSLSAIAITVSAKQQAGDVFDRAADEMDWKKTSAIRIVELCLGVFGGAATIIGTVGLIYQHRNPPYANLARGFEVTQRGSE